MQKRRLAWLVLGMGLGLGCSSSDKGSAALDPAAEDFCLHWANDVCRQAYLCVDASAQDAAFHARYGASSDNCWEGLEQRCKSNQSGSSAFGPSCGPGKKVNADVADVCTQSLELGSCDVWRAAPSGVCDLVCSIPATGSGGAGNFAGTGNSAGTGNTSNSGGTVSGTITTRADYCKALGLTLCDRLFECEPSTTEFPSAADCKTSISAMCDSSSASLCPNGFDASQAPSCITAAKTATCTELNGTRPDVCAKTCF